MTPTVALRCAVLAALLFPLPAQSLSPILSGSANTTVASMSSWRRNIALAPNGDFWALVREVDAQDAHLYLRRSTDSGQTWTGKFDTPTSGDGTGAVVYGVDCNVIHVVWHANDGGAYNNAYYQAFDTGSQTWIGNPDLLAAGTGSNDQYMASDIEVTEKGTVVVGYNTHRGPPAAQWTSGWSTGIVIKPHGSPTFSGKQQVNTDSYGVQLDMQAVGETVHMAFRTNTGLYGIRYRAFDTAAMAFTTGSDIQVEPGTANTSCIAADDAGNLYVLYVTGGTAPGTGEIRVAYAAAGSYGTWTPQTLAPDPDLVRGNVTYYHFGLARGAGGLVFALYSKRTIDQYNTLYFRVLSGGAPVTAEMALIPTNDQDRFLQVNGLRNTQSTTTIIAAVESRAAIHQGNQVDFFSLATTGRATTFGLACQGSHGSLPSLRASSLPATGTTFSIDFRGLPASQSAVMFAGIRCLTTPLSLAFLGMPSCALYQDTPGYAAFASSATGTATINLPIPANPGYAGRAILFQGFVLAPGANQFGGLVTNATMAYVR